jgi:GT2 family glycosyltransferase
MGGGRNEGGLMSVCVPVYRVRETRNIHTLVSGLGDALTSGDCELVVALNGADPASVSIPIQARVVDLGVNRGVAAGWNAAADAARGDILTFANDDTELDASALYEMRAALDSLPGAGVVGPMGMTQIPTRYGRRSPITANDAALEVASVYGFLMAMRRDVYDQAGGFDERYTPCLWEEIDFCTAVRVKLGLSCYALPGLNVRHRFDVSARRSLPWNRIWYSGCSESLRSIRRRNRRLFFEKWPEPQVAVSGHPYRSPSP